MDTKTRLGDLDSQIDAYKEAVRRMENDVANACDRLADLEAEAARIRESGVGHQSPDPDGGTLALEACAAVQRYHDWAVVNEAGWSGWGDGVVPPAAEWWRVKSGQALSALRECLL